MCYITYTTYYITYTIYHILYIIHHILYVSYTTERVRCQSQHAEVPESAGGGGVGR